MADTMVENPELGWLRALKGTAETATAQVPTIDAPTGSIGPGPAWTGEKARSTHSDLLSPTATDLKKALTDVVGDVQDAIDAVSPREVSEATAKFMRNDRAHAG